MNDVRFNTFIRKYIDGDNYTLTIHFIQSKELYQLSIDRFEEGDVEIKWTVTAKGRTILEAFDILEKLFKVYLEAELPSGIIGLLPKKQSKKKP